MAIQAKKKRHKPNKKKPKANVQQKQAQQQQQSGNNAVDCDDNHQQQEGTYVGHRHTIVGACSFPWIFAEFREKSIYVDDSSF